MEKDDRMEVINKQSVDDLYYMLSVDMAIGAAMVGPMGGMVGGPVGSNIGLMAIGNLADKNNHNKK